MHHEIELSWSCLEAEWVKGTAYPTTTKNSTINGGTIEDTRGTLCAGTPRSAPNWILHMRKCAAHPISALGIVQR